MDKSDQSFEERMNTIYDELWQMQEETALGVEDREGLVKVINLIDNVLGR